MRFRLYSPLNKTSLQYGISQCDTQPVIAQLERYASVAAKYDTRESHWMPYLNSEMFSDHYSSPTFKQHWNAIVGEERSDMAVFNFMGLIRHRHIAMHSLCLMYVTAGVWAKRAILVEPESTHGILISNILGEMKNPPPIYPSAQAMVQTMLLRENAAA